MKNLFIEPLNSEEFDKYFDQIFERTKEVLKIKAKEYIRNNDCMHNFNMSAIKTNSIRERAIQSFRLKHEISIDDIINDMENGIEPNKEIISEKFGDRLNYNILEEISILHRLNYDRN